MSYVAKLERINQIASEYECKFDAVRAQMIAEEIVKIEDQGQHKPEMIRSASANYKLAA